MTNKEAMPLIACRAQAMPWCYGLIPVQSSPFHRVKALNSGWMACFQQGLIWPPHEVVWGCVEVEDM